jgi:succinate-semialdehyde dehydrogenase/glutarate-semialdehyde dehydrogenase
LVHEKIYDVFIAKLSKAVEKLKVGNGMETGVNIDPLINKKAVETTKYFVADALEKGGEFILGGSAIGDCFFEPTIIGNATKDMRFSNEEIFGPVAPIYKFKTDKEAISMASDTVYGLASYFYSEGVSRYWKVAEALEYGMVGD